MKKLYLSKRLLLIGLVLVVGIFSSRPTADACFSAKVKPTTVDINLPIAELQGLIQQLQDAGSQIVGEAGVQIRQSIDQLNSMLTQRIDQIKNAGEELIAEASLELQNIINNLVIQAKSLLDEVNKMIQQNIQCIDQVLAARINQITEAAYGIVDKVDVALKNAIDRIYIRATMLVDSGTSRVALVLDNTLQIIAKIVIFIFCVVMLFWLIRMLWAGKFPKNKVLKFGVPVFIVVLIGLGTLTLFNSKILAKLIGKEIPVPNWQNSCNKGSEFYASFFEKKNSGATDEDLKSTGNNALEQLNWCLYASISPEVSQETAKKINEINAILYPPEIPPTNPAPLPAGNPCANTGGGVSINPLWLNKYNLAKLQVVQDLSDNHKVTNIQVISKEMYMTRLNQVSTNNLRVNEVVTAPVQKIESPVKKINPKIIELLKTQ